MSDFIDELISRIKVAEITVEDIEGVEIKITLDEIRATAERAKRLEKAFNPRAWTPAMSKAWHENLPDTEKAFSALLDAVLNEDIS